LLVLDRILTLIAKGVVVGGAQEERFQEPAIYQVKEEEVYDKFHQEGNLFLAGPSFFKQKAQPKTT
jgi:hypothetical protein